MGFVPTIYPKTIVAPNPGVMPREVPQIYGTPYHNAFNFDLLGGVPDLINNIIGTASGNTAAAIQAQQAQAAALQAQADAEKAKALRRNNTVAVVAISGVVVLALGGMIIYLKLRKKGA